MFQEILYTSALMSIVIALIILPFFFRARKKISLTSSGEPQSIGLTGTMGMLVHGTSPRILPIIQDSFPVHPFENRQEYGYSIEIDDLPSDEDLVDWAPDAESVLMKEAEDTVEKIQNVLDTISSYPPNPEEVFSKIKAVVSPQKIFLDTEYYEAINHFILVAVKRDAKIEFTEREMASLWKE